MHGGGDEGVAQAEVLGGVFDILPVEIGVPDGCARNGVSRVTSLGSAEAVVDVVVLEEQRQRQANLLNDLGRHQAGPPGVVVNAQATQLVVLAHVHVGVTELGVVLLDGQCLPVVGLAGAEKAGRVEQEEHLRTEQHRLFRAHSQGG